MITFCLNKTQIEKLNLLSPSDIPVFQIIDDQGKSARLKVYPSVSHNRYSF
jgi:hypothetical protein